MESVINADLNAKVMYVFSKAYRYTVAEIKNTVKGDWRYEHM